MEGGDVSLWCSGMIIGISETTAGEGSPTEVNTSTTEELSWPGPSKVGVGGEVVLGSVVWGDFVLSSIS